MPFEVIAVGFLVLVTVFVVFHQRRSGWSWRDFATESAAMLWRVLVGVVTQSPERVLSAEPGDPGDAPAVSRTTIILLIVAAVAAAIAAAFAIFG